MKASFAAQRAARECSARVGSSGRKTQAEDAMQTPEAALKATARQTRPPAREQNAVPRSTPEQ